MEKNRKKNRSRTPLVGYTVISTYTDTRQVQGRGTNHASCDVYPQALPTSPPQKRKRLPETSHSLGSEIVSSPPDSTVNRESSSTPSSSFCFSDAPLWRILYDKDGDVVDEPAPANHQRTTPCARASDKQRVFGTVLSSNSNALVLQTVIAVEWHTKPKIKEIVLYSKMHSAVL